MSLSEHVPIVGAARDASCRKTVEVMTGKLRRLGRFPAGGRLLDVGCGEGIFTRTLGQDFAEVVGIDVQEKFLERFRQVVQHDPKFQVLNLSIANTGLEAGVFDTIITIETLEHVSDLAAAAVEISRLLRPQGELLISVPNRWFPFENHGLRLGKWEKGCRVPLLTYWPWLHRKLALARVFTVRDLDRWFVPQGLKRTEVDYVWPTFEHGGNPFQRLLRPMFSLMRYLENSPLRMFGSSVMVRYTK
jgi:SAM-dependent methyltransferase